MRRKASDPLRDALASLVRSEALLVESQAVRDREVAEIRKEGHEFRKEMADFRRDTNERFNRLEAILMRLVEILPEAVRVRIGIKPEPQT